MKDTSPDHRQPNNNMLSLFSEMTCTSIIDNAIVVVSLIGCSNQHRIRYWIEKRLTMELEPLFSVLRCVSATKLRAFSIFTVRFHCSFLSGFDCSFFSDKVSLIAFFIASFALPPRVDHLDVVGRLTPMKWKPRIHSPAHS
jgi:hypothetical protein